MLFSPLDRGNCLFFYILSILSFALFIVTVAVALFGETKKWKVMLMASTTPFLAYYVYRLLFSMCNASLSV